MTLSSFSCKAHYYISWYFITKLMKLLLILLIRNQSLTIHQKLIGTLSQTHLFSNRRILVFWRWGFFPFWWFSKFKYLVVLDWALKFWNFRKNLNLVDWSAIIKNNTYNNIQIHKYLYTNTQILIYKYTNSNLVDWPANIENDRPVGSRPVRSCGCHC